MPTYKHVAVFGAGTMGHAIALVHALAGCNVNLTDSSKDRLQSAHQQINSVLTTFIEAGEIPIETVNEVLERINLKETPEDAIFEADLIVEAVYEDPATKKSVYEIVAKLASPNCILASNTSFLDVFPLIPTALQNKSMIVHWYSPPYIIDLVDVVPGPVCDADEVSRMTDFLTSIKKYPVVLKKFVPGYLANRIQRAINEEVFALIDQNIASPVDIDNSIIHGLALRLALMGQFKKMDYTGLDIVQKVFSARENEKPSTEFRCQLLDRLVSEGALGAKTGRGFYNYQGAETDGLYKNRDLNLLNLRRELRHSLTSYQKGESSLTNR